MAIDVEMPTLLVINIQNLQNTNFLAAKLTPPPPGFTYSVLMP